MKQDARYDLKAQYRIKMMASLAFVLLVAVLLVRLWPEPRSHERDLVFLPPGETIVVQQIQPTTQQPPRTPPPPRPVHPIPVPDDTILDEMHVEQTDIPPAAGAEQGAEGEADGVPAFVAHAEQGPRSLRLVEPEYPPAAQRAGIRARIVVEVRVDSRGNVEESRIVGRYLLNSNGREQRVSAELGYGLEEAALAAAGRWRFRPALHRGVPVGTITTLTFSFGV